jgi:hypothetical protein
MPKFAIVLLLSAVCCSAGPISGPLATGNILDWNLTVTDDRASVKSFTLDNANSQVGVQGADLTEDANNLYFNFGASDNGWLLFQASTLFDGKTFWCNASSAYNPVHPTNSCSDQTAPGENVSSTMGDSEQYPLSTKIAIGSGGTVSGADMVYTIDQTWTYDGYDMGVSGTVTTGPIPGAVPEPSTLGFLGLGMAMMAFWKFRASRSS